MAKEGRKTSQIACNFVGSQVEFAYQIRNDDLPEKPCFVSIYNPTEGIKEHDSHQIGEGSTEAEALCLAYLEAIEAVKG